jgi:hypothetical protein
LDVLRGPQNEQKILVLAMLLARREPQRSETAKTSIMRAYPRDKQRCQATKFGSGVEQGRSLSFYCRSTGWLQRESIVAAKKLGACMWRGKKVLVWNRGWPGDKAAELFAERGLVRELFLPLSAGGLDWDANSRRSSSI